jgi:hypothetical protein
VRLSWNEIRARAAAFANEWKDARYERGETQTFYNEFFQIFGVTRRRVATFEEPVKRLGDRQGFIDLFWKGVLLVEQKSAGRNLVRAREQALNYFPGLKEYELPRYVLVSDFQSFELHDLEEGGTVKFRLADLAQNVEAFGFILGVKKRSFHDQDPVNIIASELMAELHDALKASGYDGHDLERFLVRLVFCLFADDTGIFEPVGIFEELVASRSREDGSDLGPLLDRLFQILNTPEDKRQKSLDEDLARFPYVNGDLFAERLPTPDFSAAMRKLLLDACGFKWDAISPAIFGSLFQAVMDAKERRKQGAHYTTEKNILKVIQPLFLDDLYAEWKRIKALKSGRERAVRGFHDRLAGLRFLDPACGCGNFLIIAYRELRELEHLVLLELYPKRQLNFDVAALSRVDVNQFYGIEFSEFPARIAEVALWMMDHIMNVRLSLLFGRNYARIPLKQSPHIVHADALEVNWAAVLPPEQCSYVLGNPPFIGAKYQSDQQRAQVRRIAALGGSGGTLDYVCAWFIRAGAYVRGQACRIGFVATNSVTQGEQVAQLWPLLFGRHRLEIAFAHRTFAWGSDARGKAHVHVVIIGLAPRELEPAEKRLFSYEDVNGEPTESRHRVLSPYLFDAANLRDRHLVVEEVSQPLCDVPRLVTGTQPIDGGFLIFDELEKAEFLQQEPSASPYMRPFLGAEEYINGKSRWILVLKDVHPAELRAMPNVRMRLSQVSGFRRSSKRNSTLALADHPTRFNVDAIPDGPFLAIPEVSSERRPYLPVGWLEPPTVPSNKLRMLLNADHFLFAIIVSRMHTAWTRFVGGRLKSDFQYSVGINYNAFPWPTVSTASHSKILLLGAAVLKVRATFVDATLADLYDPDAMPSPLRKAHQDLDNAVDRLYRPQPFASDRERVEHLFMLYEKLRDPLIAATGKARKGRAAGRKG